MGSGLHCFYRVPRLHVNGPLGTGKKLREGGGDRKGPLPIAQAASGFLLPHDPRPSLTHSHFSLSSQAHPFQALLGQLL